MTAATAAHCRLYRRFGIQRILLANQLVSPSAVAWVCEELRRDREFEFFCLVDSPRGVALLDSQLTRFGAPRPLPVLAEVGFAGGRAGARGRDALLATVAAARAAVNLELVGLECYEGLFAAADTAASLDLVEEYLEGVADSFLALLGAGALPHGPLLSAGGSAFFDLVVAKLGPMPATLVLRSGCYVTQDGGFYDAVSPLGGRGERVLENAIELWSTVLSRPEPGFAVVDFGRRDAPFDQGLPTPTHRRAGTGPEVRLAGAEVVRLSDQHAHLSIPESEQLAVGDLVRCDISHPCGAFDRWRVIPVVDRERAVVDAVMTFF
ncbi:MAG TPA: hypothetical protein VN522_05505, partial [Solirubrobacterales bacterium]|nr:hypothetical protein [Solirubrobacterales bacterium]